jgi:membrane protease YdiL (CAAX protease family)
MNENSVNNLQIENESPTVMDSKSRLLSYFHSNPPIYENRGKQTIPWQTKDILLWVLCAASISAIYYVLSHNAYLRYRPWLAAPFLFTITFAIYVFVIVYGAMICRSHPSWPLIAIINPRMLFKECIVACKYLIVVSLILAPITLFLSKGLRLPTEYTKSFLGQFASSSIYSIVNLCVMFTLAPIAEEYFFRGLLYNALRSKLNIALAASVQAFVFSLVHFQSFFGSIII